VQYCVQQLCTVQCTHMSRPYSCLLVKFSFSVAILCVTVYLLDLAFWGNFVLQIICVCVLLLCYILFFQYYLLA